MAKKTATDKEEPKFEESVSRLQLIVAELESGSLGLEESLARFEQGTGLLRACYQFLESAEQKIEILTRLSEDGTGSTKPFDSEASADKADTQRRGRQADTAGVTPRDESETNDDEVPPDADVRSLFD